jgi:hypothetical protein
MQLVWPTSGEDDRPEILDDRRADLGPINARKEIESFGNRFRFQQQRLVKLQLPQYSI